jgi:hypothetical protein
MKSKTASGRKPKYPFKSMKIKEVLTFSSFEDFLKASQAAYQVNQRDHRRFSCDRQTLTIERVK